MPNHLSPQKISSDKSAPILFLGMLNRFSYVNLLAMLASEHRICCILVPAEEVGRDQEAEPISAVAPQPARSELPLLNPYLASSVVNLAWENEIPIYAVQDLARRQVRQFVENLAPAVACVACFSRKIPRDILDVPDHGFINVHPSLLPDYRGPAPLFWIFHDGVQDQTGISVHLMDEALDTGPIVCQAPLSLPDGISGPEADIACAQLSGQLLVEVVGGLLAGTLNTQPQPPGGSYFPWPAYADFTLNTAWPARRAYNFMRGTAEWGRLYPVTANGETFLLREAVSYEPAASPLPIVKREGEIVHLSFSPGVLTASL